MEAEIMSIKIRYENKIFKMKQAYDIIKKKENSVS
jgi:hypothetical protein